MKDQLKLLKQVYMGINLQLREIPELAKPQAEGRIEKILLVLEELYEYHNKLLIEFLKRKNDADSLRKSWDKGREEQKV